MNLKRIEGLVNIEGKVKKLVLETQESAVATISISGVFQAPNKKYRTVADFAADFDSKYFPTAERLEKDQYNFIPDWIMQLPVVTPPGYKAPVVEPKVLEIEPEVTPEVEPEPIEVIPETLVIPPKTPTTKGTGNGNKK